MNLALLKQAQWKQRRKVAELSANGRVIITLEFIGRKVNVRLENRQLQIRKEGFWHPYLVMVEQNKIIASQKQINFWAKKYEVQIGARYYYCKIKTGVLYNVTYFPRQSHHEIVSYRLNAFKWKPVVQFTLNETAAPADDALLLFLLGYYSIKTAVQESAAVAAIVAAS